MNIPTAYKNTLIRKEVSAIYVIAFLIQSINRTKYK